MNQNLILAIAASAGLITGAGGTWLAVSNTPTDARAITKAELTAAISADPSLCPIPETPVVEAPTEAEALAAFRKAKANSPLVWDRDNMPEVSLALGQCDKNATGPGVSCMTTIKLAPQAEPQNKIIGFAKTASGEWVATLF
ncbi:hypothetical protein [Ochrobactrum sp. 3-3]|uniref:hypothetical protein n=1 Tax=Ochrobactrum sp. 3-3 TaxID=1830124 RepID=UPI000DEEEC7B|nr:hypothetical protein [Ochrobactrum sp. 3-3]